MRRLRSGLRTARQWLRDAPPTVLLLRASLLTVLVNSNEDPPAFIAVAVICVIALPRAHLLERSWFWAALFFGLGARQALTWHLVDDHIIVTTYWCGALALALGARDTRATAAASARLLVGSIFALAAAWKLGSGQFIDGSFFRYTLLFDDRFATVAQALGGTTAPDLQSNIARVTDLLSGAGPGDQSVVLAEGPRNAAVARLFTLWGVFIEAAVAATFLLPLPRRHQWLRHAALVGFAATTYLVVPVGGFGVLLLVLGSAQATSTRGRLAYLLGALVLTAWTAVWPLLFL